MAIREDLVVSAVQFLQDPSVSSSSVENRISFLRSKNLTQEEIDAALARSGGNAPPPPPPPPQGYANASGPPQPYYQPYPQNAWQAPPAAPPGRDWRDWFIMATVVSGVGYGLYSLGKRYVYPLIAPPTPEKLEQDKKSIEDQFDRAFSLVEQLAQDTEALKKSEQERSERLDGAIGDLESVMTDLRSANRRREDDARRIQDEMQSLRDSIPKALESQKTQTDERLKELNTELVSLKTLLGQRVGASSNPVTSASFMRSSTTPVANTSSSTTNGTTTSPSTTTTNNNTTSTNVSENTGTSAPATSEPPKSSTPTSFSRASPLAGGAAKASIPAWQMAMSKNPPPPPPTVTDENKEVEVGGGSSSAAQ